MDKKFKILRTLLNDAEKYHKDGEAAIARTILKSASGYAEDMSKTPTAIKGFNTSDDGK